MKGLFLLVLIFLSGCSSSYVAMEEEIILKENREFSIGNDILLDGISYRVNAVESYIEIGKSSVSKKTEGLFYMVYLTVMNVGLSEGYVFSPGIVLVDNNGKRFDQDLKAKFYINEVIDWDRGLVRDEALSGVVIFDLPKDTDGLKLEIRNDWRDTNKVFIPIPDSRVSFRGVSEAVTKAREEDKLLRAGIN